MFTSTAAFRRRFASVPGERMLAKIRWSSSQTTVVPLGETFGVPSAQTVAKKPRRCSSTTRFMSAVRIPMNLVPIAHSHHFNLKSGLWLRRQLVAEFDVSSPAAAATHPCRKTFHFDVATEAPLYHERERDRATLNTFF